MRAACRPTPIRCRTPALAVAAVAVLLLLGSAPLASQTLRGTLADAGTRQPIGGAMVILLSESGAAVASTLTDEQGRFVLRGAGPGRYRVRAERIGYRSHTGPELALAFGEERGYVLTVAAEAIQLEGIVARGDRRCRVRPREGLATAHVWEETRKALATTAWVQRESVFRYAVDLVKRKLEPERLSVLEEEVERKTGYQTRPFVSVPVEKLMERGFVHTEDGGAYYDYFAPDADVLLSDAFLDTHCLRLVRGQGQRAGQVGIAFEPIRGRRVPEIQGTFWLDQRSALLKELEYRYTNLPWSISSDHVGGRVEFALLPAGVLIVRRWTIRMPRLALSEQQWQGTTRREIQIRGYSEQGGEVRWVRDAKGDSVPLTERATLTGEVFDGTRSLPLRGARVSLAGTESAALTDSAGRFQLLDLPEGRYSVIFSHPRLDSLPALASPATEVELRAGATASVRLTVPSVAALLEEACRDVRTGAPATSGEPEGVAYGVVRDTLGAPIPRAVVQLTWSRWGVNSQPGVRSGRGDASATVREQRWSAETLADDRGRYLACGLPVGVPIRVEAQAAGAGRVGATLTLSPNRLVPLELAPRPGAPDRHTEPAGSAEPTAPDYVVEGVVVEALSAEARKERELSARGTRAHHLSRAEIDQVLPRVGTFPQLLRAMNTPGLTVRDDVQFTDPASGGQRGVCVQAGRNRTGGDTCRMVEVYLNGARLGRPELQLLGIAPETVEEIEFLPALEAGARFGTGSANGVLLIRTRSGSR